MATQLQTRVHELARAEAVELLQMHAFVGRIGFVVDGRPMILPVNYLADDVSIVFCTAPGTKLSAIGGGASVVFEVDDSRALYHAGWSVLVTGIAELLTLDADIERARHLPLRAWAPGPHPFLVRVPSTLISGRRLAWDGLDDAGAH